MKTFKEVYRDSGLGKWFHNQSAGGKPGWDRYDSSGKKSGKCGDAKDGEPYAACLSRQKAQKLGKKGVASFVRRKRKAQSAAGKGDKGDGGKGAKPINVKTGVTDKDPKKKGIQEMKTFRDLKVELQEKNVPTNPSLWSSVLSQARSKFDVYPSAYANAWASKQYKKKGGGWKKKTNEDVECPCEDCVCDPCDCGQVDEVAPVAALAGRAALGVGKYMVKKKVGDAALKAMKKRKQQDEEVEQVDEAVNLSSLLRDKEGYYRLSIKSPKKKVSIFVDHEAPDRDSQTLVYIEVNGKEKLGKEVSSSELKKILKTYLDDAKREGARVSVAERGHPDDPFNEEVEQVDEKSAAWQRKEGKNREGGLNAAGRRSYERENPGSDLKAPVSAAQAKKSKGGKAAKRRKSFCARMGGMPGPMKDEKGRPTRKALALRKWDC